jgi:hypothetical protein
MPEMRLWRRRRQASPVPQVVLPSLDRLAGLIERVVELVDEVAGARGPGSNHAPAAPPAAPPAPPPAAPTRAPEAPVPEPAAESDGWLAFVPSPNGYTLVPRPNSLPVLGAVLELDGAVFRVLRYAPSPLPGDRRRCAVVVREEPPEADRSFDA